ncbi:MAG: DUF362 domain-containing protein [Polyangiaceae bacterium]|nr:DUF362 domain-containing protein [Polyangiaceae bacterium]
MDRQVFARRAMLGGAVAAAAGLVLSKTGDAFAGSRGALIAKPPAGFLPLSMPGKVVRVDKADTLQPNGLWPKQESATAMLERVMAELTGKSDVGEAFAKFVHKDDKVAIKPNGIAGRLGATMASNKELVLAVVKGIIKAGVPATNIMIYEQYPSFMKGTRVVKDGQLDPDFPAGIATSVHENKDATMDEIQVAGKGTKFARPFTEATCVINLGMIKDHSICGFTGAMKNITHGTIINPHDFHEHNASPQIAQLYAQDIVKSRVRLHIADAFKLIYDEGPLDKNPKRRVPHEALYASTDPVALDVIGWGVIEQLRKDNGLPTLKDAGREPSYIKAAGELGLGVFDKNAIRLRQVKI